MRAGGAVAGVAAVALLAGVPFVVRRDDVLNFFVITLLTITLAQSWNIVGGYAGQLSAGHAAFVGIGGYTAALLFERGVTPLSNSSAAV